MTELHDGGRRSRGRRFIGGICRGRVRPTVSLPCSASVQLSYSLKDEALGLGRLLRAGVLGVHLLPVRVGRLVHRSHEQVLPERSLNDRRSDIFLFPPQSATDRLIGHLSSQCYHHHE